MKQPNEMTHFLFSFFLSLIGRVTFYGLFGKKNGSNSDNSSNNTPKNQCGRKIERERERSGGEREETSRFVQ